MTRLVFLSSTEKRTFDSPSVLTQSQRPAYFVVTDDSRKTMASLRTNINKVGFLLQLGYFKYSGKLLEKSAFHPSARHQQLLDFTNALEFTEYQPSRMTQY